MSNDAAFPLPSRRRFVGVSAALIAADALGRFAFANRQSHFNPITWI